MAHSAQAKTSFKPTAGMLSAANLLTQAMAYENTIRPIVEAYQRKILAGREWKVAPEMLATLVSFGPFPDVITDITQTYLMSAEDAAEFDSLCNAERIKSGLPVESEDKCPLLVIKSLVRESRQLLLQNMEPITNISADKALMMTPSKQKAYVDMTLDLLVPFIAKQSRLSH